MVKISCEPVNISVDKPESDNVRSSVIQGMIHV